MESSQLRRAPNRLVGGSATAAVLLKRYPQSRHLIHTRISGSHGGPRFNPIGGLRMLGPFLKPRLLTIRGIISS